MTRESHSRRGFLTAVGAVGLAGLAGCAENSTESSPTSGDTPTEEQDGVVRDDEPVPAVTVASLNPLSGGYSALGPSQRAGVELAVEQINANDDYEFELDLVFGDTESEAAAAQQETQRVVQQEQADFVFGAISNSVSLALNEYAKAAEFVYFSGGAAVPITGSSCNEWVFRCETNVAQIAEAISAYSVDNLGTDVWFHTAEYAYGDSVYDRVKERMQADTDVAEIGHTTSPLGTSNFDSDIRQISNSGADTVVLGLSGGDLVSFVNQAADLGLPDEMALVAPTMTARSIRAGTGDNAVGTYGGVRYLPGLELGDNQQFVEAYRNAQEVVPDNYARVGYDSIRLMAKGMHVAGTTDSGDVRDTLSGGTFTTVLGDVTLREGDHQATNPTWMGELVDGGGDIADVSMLGDSMVPGDETLASASDYGCQM